MSDTKAPGRWPELPAVFCDTVRELIQGGMSAHEVIKRLTRVVEVISGDIEDLQRKAWVAEQTAETAATTSPVTASDDG